MNKAVLLAALAAVSLGVPAMAEDGPSFDCAKAESEAEKLVCSDADLARLDRLAAERFAAALAAAEAMDAGAEAAAAELRATQRGWIKGRDECWKAEDLRSCVEASYLMRDGQLTAGWMLQEPESRVFWTCGGNPADELVTFFFDTELPSVRFERGDTVDTGSLVPAASGSKYEGSFGRSLWIKGEEALYREADPDGSEVNCAVAAQE